MSGPNKDQEDFWRDQAGHIWVDQRAAMDAALAPVLDLVLDHARLGSGERVLDIGCGAGTSTLAAAELTGSDGGVCGLDISQTLLDAAMVRADAHPQVSFALADAQTHGFEQAATDCVLSRFGVMFFDDPTAAFANLASALRPDGRMVMAAWGAIGQNPYFTMPAGVAKNLLGPIPKSDPDAPGPFAFREAESVIHILANAGLADVSVIPVDLALTPQGNAQEVAALMCQIGPAQSALKHHDADTPTQRAMQDALALALQDFVTPQGIRIPGQINLITARKPA
ncbi:Methyltransferase, UbiE/COQ5 family [Sulfitobacter noctilucicola]|uniref:SAM-dependent methyltransferase n=1 Tax=Sulfitobacter noctilucicola TaxID=1342301 RepID=A0A7W6Q5H6_9RHOB|nr:class I SAM-dependent methyltransferase [Sulfitobacter noctilucicola]KIN65091.1 Methyltransferase, UbiE/COQ5 family [Sulfitobacter noctilucicola]MBB4173770.1 SAM-dependent methyltransferase [Sulfitobacter noctilucicola]